MFREQKRAGLCLAGLLDTGWQLTPVTGFCLTSTVFFFLLLCNYYCPQLLTMKITSVFLNMLGFWNWISVMIINR